jgi:hypothetical protein
MLPTCAVIIQNPLGRSTLGKLRLLTMSYVRHLDSIVALPRSSHTYAGIGRRGALLVLRASLRWW